MATESNNQKLWELREKRALVAAAVCYTLSPEIHLVKAGSTHSQQTVSPHLNMSACHGSTFTEPNPLFFKGHSNISCGMKGHIATFLWLQNLN